jgi:hypothetical protein
LAMAASKSVPAEGLPGRARVLAALLWHH